MFVRIVCTYKLIIAMAFSQNLHIHFETYIYLIKDNL